MNQQFAPSYLCNFLFPSISKKKQSCRSGIFQTNLRRFWLQGTPSLVLNNLDGFIQPEEEGKWNNLHSNFSRENPKASKPALVENLTRSLSDLEEKVFLLFTFWWCTFLLIFFLFRENGTAAATWPQEKIMEQPEKLSNELD